MLDLIDDNNNNEIESLKKLKVKDDDLMDQNDDDDNDDISSNKRKHDIKVEFFVYFKTSDKHIIKNFIFQFLQINKKSIEPRKKKQFKN